MAGTDREYDILRKLVQRDRRELDEVRHELEEIGRELRSEHIRRARQDLVSEAETGARLNTMCRRCFNSCKQPQEVRIHHCARFKPID